MSALRAAVLRLLEVVAVHDGDEYTWLGRRFSSAAEPGAATLESRLHGRLYADFFCTGGVVPSSDPNLRPGRPRPDRAFLAALSDANAARFCRQRAWRIEREEGPVVVIERSGLRLYAAPSDLEHEGDGPRVTLMAPSERRAASPGFLTLLAEEELETSSEPHVDRHYWNLRPDGAAPAVASLTRRLNRSGVPFRLKVAEHPVLYGRCDAGVLYSRRSDRDLVRAIALETHRDVVAHLRDRVPAFTLRLAPGLGFAEDPRTDESFGWSRCRLLARGLVAAHTAGATSAHERAAVIESTFAGAGLDPDRPHLDPATVAAPSEAAA